MERLRAGEDIRAAVMLNHHCTDEERQWLFRGTPGSRDKHPGYPCPFGATDKSRLRQSSVVIRENQIEVEGETFISLTPDWPQWTETHPKMEPIGSKVENACGEN